MTIETAVDHRQLVNYFTACIEAENRAQGSFSIDRTVLEYPRGTEPTLGGWAELPDIASTDRWLRDRRLAADRETVNVGWPLITTGGDGATVAPLFVAEAELDVERRRVRVRTATMSVSPAALRLAGFDAGEIETLLRSFDGHEDLTVAGLRLWMTKIGFAETGETSAIVQPTAVVFVGEDTSAITYFLVNDLAAVAKLSGSALTATALGAVLSGADAAEARWDPTQAALPTNLAQERACQLASNDPLTLVTGPPGTGKSQVLVNTAVAAVCRGETVLIASRNNHAIEVVLERLERIDRAIVVPRIGRKDLRGEAARTILGALDRTPFDSTTDDADRAWRQAADGLREPFDALRERSELTAHMNALELEIVELAVGLHDRLRTWEAEEDLELIRSSLAAATEARAAADVAPSRWFWQRGSARRLHEQAASALRQTIALMGPMAATVLEEAAVDDPADTIALINRTLALDVRRRARNDLRTRLELLPSDQDVEDLVNAVHDRTDASVALVASRLEYLRRPGSPAASAARDFANALAAVATKGGGVRALPPKFPGALQAFPLWVTTSQSASSLLPMSPGLFDLVIIDEAGQADFASALPLLARAKRAMIVGDPRQLQHITQIPARAEEDLAGRAGIPDQVQSEFNYIANSLYGVIANRLDSTPILLRDHFRSHPDIIGISNRAFYGDQLRIHTPAAGHDLTPVEWHPVSGTFERGPNGRSAKNLHEAHEAVRIAEQLARRGLSVGIVSPFRAQVNAIRGLVSEADDIAVDTAHGFQGDERDAIVVSLVVNGDASEYLWAHAGNNNLVNVAITRARSVLRIVGDKEACLRSKTVLNELAHMIGRP